MPSYMLHKQVNSHETTDSGWSSQIWLQLSELRVGEAGDGKDVGLVGWQRCIPTIKQSSENPEEN